MDVDPLGWNLVILLLLLMIYALLTAAESAARVLNKNKLRKLAEEADTQADRLLTFAQKLTDTPSGLRACLAFVGFLSAGLVSWLYGLGLARALRGAGAFGAFSDGLLGGLSILVVLIVYTVVMLAFATVLPRRLAVHQPEKTASRLYRIATFFDSLFHPLACLVNGVAAGLLRLAGINPHEEMDQLTEDEIRLLVDVGEEKGAIQEAEREMIENVFEFNNLTAADSMTHRTDMWTVWIDDDWEEITRLIESTGLSRFPVYDEDLDHVIGTVSTRDFLLNRQKEQPKPLREILRKARFVPESVRTDVLFRDMQHNKYHMAIVVDEYGGTSGLITMEDLLEEIVGNIYDEYDPQVQQDIVDIGEARWRVAGSLLIESFNEATGLDLPIDEEYDTMGGLVLHHLGAIPEDGSQTEVEAFGLHFKVLEIADRRIEWVEVDRSSPATEEENV
ncbi:MAG: HlyC/CorC family transporter [Clostridiales bacterium]|jgi:putative hemolysin|nr:HlyC/CorC family transporter [Clostridiales bacterium]